MVRHYNWFTGRRNRDHRSGPQVPVCSRHGHMRYDVAEGSSDYSTEEERRERRRRRELRNSLREEDEDRTEREKKRSTKSRICAWLNCFCGILIVFGLVFVFYVITTLIIDGSSPLDFISFSNNNTSLVNSTKSKNFSVPLEDSATNGINKRTTDKETVTKSISTFSPVSTTFRTSTKNKENKVFDKTSGEDDSKNVFESNIENHHHPELEAGRTRISYVKGSDGRSYIAFIPVRSEETSNGEPFKEGSKIKVNRNGQTSHWDEYDSRRSYEDFREPHTIKRPERNRDKYAYRRPADSYDLGSQLIPQYVPPPPNNNRRLDDNINTPPNRRQFMASPVDRSVDSPSRRPPYNREIENNHRRYRPYRRTLSPSEGRQSSRYKYRNSPPNSDESGVRSSSRFRNSREHVKRGRLAPDVSQKYNPPRSDVKRPPRDFRYPPSAGNIQDIIEYMKDKDRIENRRTQNPGHNDRVNKYPGSSEFYLGSQDHIIGYEGTDDTSHYRDTDVLEDRNPYESGDYSRDPYDKYHKDTKYIGHSQSYDPTFNSDPLPPVMNTYDDTKSGRNSRSGKPLRLILDIYPVDSHSRGSVNDIYQSTVSVEEDFRRHDLNFPYKFHEGRKKEILLRVNLLTEQPTHRSEPELRDKSLSLEIPLIGSLTPYDIYKAIVDHARKSPVAAHQRVQGHDSSIPHDAQIANDFLLNNAEKNRQLLEAIEHGLRELNVLLPETEQFSFNTNTTETQNISQYPQKFSLERSPRSTG